MTTSHWRAVSNRVIRAVIAEIGTENTTELRKAIKDAYPFGQRRYHPYKIWCSEVQHMIPGLYPSRKPVPPDPASAAMPPKETPWIQ